jgi:DNA-binding transcriptional LysR family regulator
MDRFDAMAVFLEAVETGSLSAAGRKLGMPLATVSRKLSELERHLGARLLQRSTRQLLLTDAGRDYLAACKRILEDVNEAERAVAGEYNEPRGELVITAPIVFGRLHVLPLIAEFLKAFPQVQVRLVQGDQVVNLLEEHVDLAVRIGKLPDSSLLARRIGAIRRVVCASPGYFAEYGTPRVPADLATQRCVSFEQLGSPIAWTFVQGNGYVEIPISPRLVVNTAEAAIDAAIAGVGVTRVLSYQVEAACRDGRLTLALQEFEPAPTPVSLVYAGRPRLPLKLRAFLDFAAARLTARLAAKAVEGSPIEA